ncbi:hypothetical protein E3N88_03735 [Mikania micrantha]|uniref:Reverse transcriptase RNase H-like domain-containing protein n=1 Tax=Mikania micrantha TaxID=192012 RepID=A0A5N6PTP9_9ASTR|nr:hypothetical protein E3N88_03735 [Mikania micrantha]
MCSLKLTDGLHEAQMGEKLVQMYSLQLAGDAREPLHNSRVVRSEGVQVCIWWKGGRIFGPRDIRRGGENGSYEDRSYTTVAGTENIEGTTGIFEVNRLLQAFHTRLWAHCKTPNRPTEKGCVLMEPEAQVAFENLKGALLSAPVLALPDSQKTFVVKIDASACVLGAVLMQDHHPLAFISKALSAKQQVLSVYKKELLAILMAVKQWHYYLIPNHFVIRTDQRSLKHLLTQKVTTPLQHKWLAKLMGYDYTIEYKKGRENVVADAQSRVQGTTLFTNVVSQVEPLLLQDIIASQQQDEQRGFAPAVIIITLGGGTTGYIGRSIGFDNPLPDQLSWSVSSMMMGKERKPVLVSERALGYLSRTGYLDVKTDVC